MSFNATINESNSRRNLLNETVSEKRFIFGPNDFPNTLKDSLNWTPSFELYKSVFSDMEAFKSSTDNEGNNYWCSRE